MTARFIVGDVRAVLASMPDSSVDLVLTSPPFLALRSYLPADHPDKQLEIGSEATPGAFIDTLLDLTEEFARVLTPHGSIAVELGDTYAGPGGGVTGDEHGTTRYPEGRGLTIADRKRVGAAWPEAKSLCLIPESYRWALVYGRNPFTGRETPRWRARNVVRWCRPNPPVGALGDKFRPATSEMVVACKSARRWFDLDAVREPWKDADDVERSSGKYHAREAARGRVVKYDEDARVRRDSHGGAPPLDWWEIPTQPYPGAHYATWSEKLCVRPIQAMCPREVCTACGEPRRRITQPSDRYQEVLNARPRGENWSDPETRRNDSGGRASGVARSLLSDGTQFTGAENVTVGWSDCGCGAPWRRGVVLDPFAGSGTTLAVSEGHGRDSIGIDLDSRNADLALERVGMWLTVEHHEREGAA